MSSLHALEIQNKYISTAVKYFKQKYNKKRNRENLYEIICYVLNVEKKRSVNIKITPRKMDTILGSIESFLHYKNEAYAGSVFKNTS